MTNDLTSILQDWPFDPSGINARIVDGDDGEPRLQLRVELGILQLFLDGRPDGERPFGQLSLLDHFETLLDQSLSEQEGGPGGSNAHSADDDFGKPDKFDLSVDDCRLLREEAAQYYQRYIALMALEDFDRVVRDTSRNLRVLDLCKKHAQAEEDRVVLEKFRPYITMLRSRALASQALKDNEPKAAVLALDDGLESLRSFFAEAGHPQQFERSNEVQMLRGMRDTLMPKLPVSQAAELRDRLRQAVEQENYELAAILRDELKALGEPASKPDSTTS